jgi:hypothetical protein
MSINVQYQNVSTVLTDAQVAAIMAAVMHQVAEDVAPYWGCQRLEMIFVPKAQAMEPKFFQFLVADDSNQADALGYHQTTPAGWPIGFAFAKTTIEAKDNPSVTISHELLEMVGDPLIDQACQWADNPNALFLSQELCDPVEDDSIAYLKDGIMVSDFVTPAYFVPGEAGPYDFRSVLTAPNTLAVGGYQLQWTPAGGWTQTFADDKARRRPSSVGHSRRQRRIMGRRNWLKSSPTLETDRHSLKGVR